ncbi:MAG: glycosyltransferase family 39 protein [Anaerolineae bacterium]|nr:glycosyltransferase family 39 protein [Anaerolineae bacterium]
MSQVPNLESQISNRKSQIALILLAFVLLGVFYSLATPPLEASDEFDHYPYVQYVQTQGALPVMDPADPDPWRQEGGQPPLYYLLMAGLTSWIDTSDLEDVRWLNHHAFIGMPDQVGNKNLIIHRPEREAFPWRGTVLAVHVIRLGSVALGAVTVWLVWRVAAQLCPQSGWAPLAAAALTAFNPMVLFVSAAVNNDVLAALFGSLALLILLKISDLKSQISWTSYLWLGIVLGLGALTKLSLAAMIPLALLVVALRTWRQHTETSFSRRAAWVIAHCSLIITVVLATAGWWFLRNWRLYGDPTAVNVFMQILGYRAEPLTLKDLWEEFGTFRRTYWGLFGGVNVPAPEPFYVFCDLLSLAGLVGLALRAWRRRREGIGVWWIPLLWIAILFAALLRWVVMYYSFQGRLMFPGIAALSTFLALGLGEWLPERWRPAIGWAVGGVLLALAVIVPFVSILPAYEYPAPLALADVPAEARVEPVDVGGVARIVGWEFEQQAVQPGDLAACVKVVVYWEATAPDGRDYASSGELVSFAKLLGRGHRGAGQVNRHPVDGMVPTSLWQPGQVWRDRYCVKVDPDAAAPSLLRVEVGLYDPQAGQDLGSVRVGEAKLAPAGTQALPDHALEVELSDGIALRGYDLSAGSVAPGEAITLTLHWEARGAPSADYQVFVHLVGAAPEPAAQGDGPPLMGDYPTRVWSPGELVVDPHVVTLPLDLPAGRYRLLVGMYGLETLARLPRLDGAGDSIEIPVHIEVR